MGVPMLGLAFRDAPPSTETLAVACGIGLLLVHLLALNDWSGLLQSPTELRRLGLDPATPTGPRPLLIEAWVAALVGVGVLAATHPTRGAWGLAWVGLSAAYSAPRWRTKERLLVTLAIHGAGGAVLFWLGAWPRSEPAGWAVAAFVGLVLMAGQLNHQAIDRGADQAAGLTTAAVQWGSRPLARGAMLTFVLAHAGLGAATFAGIVPPPFGPPLVAPVVVPVVALVWLGLRSPSDRGLRHLRAAYRTAFALGSAVLVARWLFGWWP
jgi:4-hydroxybenzoate polyprenyltransferase